jgi:hypothetical protein
MHILMGSQLDGPPTVALPALPSKTGLLCTHVGVVILWAVLIFGQPRLYLATRPPRAYLVHALTHTRMRVALAPAWPDKTGI